MQVTRTTKVTLNLDNVRQAIAEWINLHSTGALHFDEDTMHLVFKDGPDDIFEHPELQVEATQ